MFESIWKHKKTGKNYRVIGFCRLESDMSALVLYSPVEGSDIFARPVGQFFDGRFELYPIPCPPAGSDAILAV